MSAFEDPPSPLFQALELKQVIAEVVECDHYRVRGGLSVETDYIIAVHPPAVAAAPSQAPLFETFCLSKTYSAFRTFAQELERIRCAHESLLLQQPTTVADQEIAAVCANLVNYCQLVPRLIEGQRTQYLGKVNHLYVKVLAKERKKVLNQVLIETVTNCPSLKNIKARPFIKEVAEAIRTFFLTDHCPVSKAALAAAAPALAGDATPTASAPMTPVTAKTTIATASLDSLRNIVSTTSNIVSTTSNIVATTTTKPIHWIGGKLTQGTEKSADGADKSPKPTTADAQQPPTGRPDLPRMASVVTPLSLRERREDTLRATDELELTTMAEGPVLTLDDDANVPSTPKFVPSYTQPVPVVRAVGSPSQLGTLIDNNPLAFFGVAGVAIAILHQAQMHQVRIDADAFMLFVFAAFCLGLHTPRPMVGGYDQSSSMVGTVVQKADVSGRKLLRRSMIMLQSPKNTMQSPKSIMLSPREKSTQIAEDAAEDDEEEEDSEVGIVEPLARFPEGAPIGSHSNCWSEPSASDFEVRGPNYLVDKKKTPSGDYIFPCRGLDLFLTDTCPENVGRNPFVFGGKLREKPTFLINFRLPWGVLVMYFEIPQKFIPFVKAGFEGTAASENLPSLDDMTPGERTACRFLMKDNAHRNKTLKIIPVVVDGPWVVKSVVGGKPALIGTKLPVQYHYGPATVAPADHKELYLEADLDIAASSAARGILSVTRSYTECLTINLGFVVQGEAPDELPEQMLIGLRLHGIDPLTAPAYPEDPHNGVVDSVLKAENDAVSDD